MSGVNKVIIVGRLGIDPEIKVLESGSSVCRMSVATSESWKDKEGNKQEKTEWHSIVAWGKTAEICGQYLKKGSQAYFEGRLQTRSWDDKEGNKKYATEIVTNQVQFIGGSKQESKEPGTESFNEFDNNVNEEMGF